jgi:hypothetical protein
VRLALSKLEMHNKPLPDITPPGAATVYWYVPSLTKKPGAMTVPAPPPASKTR